VGGIFNTRTGVRKLIGRMEPDGPQYQKVMEVDWFLGQGVLIHKDIVEKVGYFDEVDFPQYHADVDYSLRAKNAGYKNLVYPNLKLLNDTSTTGISHVKNKTVKQFMESLFSLRSNTNIIKEIRFYRRHATSFRAYGAVTKRFYLYIGGFIKWKILGLFGIEKKYNEFY
jgi:GT2 family glycosyltransferase